MPSPLPQHEKTIKLYTESPFQVPKTCLSAKQKGKHIFSLNLLVICLWNVFHWLMGLSTSCLLLAFWLQGHYKETVFTLPLMPSPPRGPNFLKLWWKINPFCLKLLGWVFYHSNEKRNKYKYKSMGEMDLCSTHLLPNRSSFLSISVELPPSHFTPREASLPKPIRCNPQILFIFLALTGLCVFH